MTSELTVTYKLNMGKIDDFRIQNYCFVANFIVRKSLRGSRKEKFRLRVSDGGSRSGVANLYSAL